MTDTTDAPLSRSPARFFFETGYFAAYAEACISNGHKPPFALTDAIVDKAWEIAPEAHPNRREFDRYLHRADSADEALRAGEAAYRAHFAADREATGSRDELATCAHNLRHFGGELFPTNRAGQAHFARVIMNTAANTTDAALAARPQQGRPITEACGIAMVEVRDEDRDELERGLITQGFPPARAKELAQSQPPNDGALQMLARHRMATCNCPRSMMLAAVARPVNVDAILTRRRAGEELTATEDAEIALWATEVQGRAIRLVAELATMTDTECDFLDGFEAREVARLVQVPDDDGEIAPTLPRYYTENDRSRAISAIVARYYDGGDKVTVVTVKPGELVDMIAETLGMRRVGA